MFYLNPGVVRTVPGKSVGVSSRDTVKVIIRQPVSTTYDMEMFVSRFQDELQRVKAKIINDAVMNRLVAANKNRWRVHVRLDDVNLIMTLWTTTTGCGCMTNCVIPWFQTSAVPYVFGINAFILDKLMRDDLEEYYSAVYYSAIIEHGGLNRKERIIG